MKNVVWSTTLIIRKGEKKKTRWSKSNQSTLKIKDFHCMHLLQSKIVIRWFYPLTLLRPSRTGPMPLNGQRTKGTGLIRTWNINAKKKTIYFHWLCTFYFIDYWLSTIIKGRANNVIGIKFLIGFEQKINRVILTKK